MTLIKATYRNNTTSIKLLTRLYKDCTEIALHEVLRVIERDLEFWMLKTTSTTDRVVNKQKQE